MTIYLCLLALSVLVCEIFPSYWCFMCTVSKRRGGKSQENVSIHLNLFLFLKLESLKSKHEVLRKDLEDSHAEKMESIKRQYEQSLEGELSVF